MTQTSPSKLSLMFHPPPEVAQLDTGLRFTDILFGFVIKEIFVRLQYWQNLPGDVLLYLGVSTALVLGSWIGYRRSLNRSAYEVKFFNLPFFRFVLDQGMLVLYFQIASATPADLGRPPVGNSAPVVAPDLSVLGTSAVTLLVIVFIVYLFWDFLGIRMAYAKDKSGQLRYPAIKEKKITNPPTQQRADWWALAITAIALLFFVGLLLSSTDYGFSISAGKIFVLSIILLILYRFAKEVKTSWRQPAISV